VGVTGYRIYRNGANTPFQTVGNVTSYVDTAVQANTSYSYQVSAIDAAGNESSKVTAEPSPIITPQLSDTQAPTAPSRLQATLITSNSDTLSWTASTDNVAVTGYHVYRGTTLVGSTSSTSYTDNGLSPNTTYRYAVKAYDAAGNLSAASNTLSVKTSRASSTTQQKSWYQWRTAYFSSRSSPPVVTSNNANIIASAPVTIQPATIQEQGVKQVTYYVNNKMVANVGVVPFAYHLNSTGLLNGQYTLTAKVLYASGAIQSVTQNLTLANAWSWTQLGLFTRHYLTVPLLAIVILLAIWIVTRRVLRLSTPGIGLGGLFQLQEEDDGPTIIRPTSKTKKSNGKEE
jgi:chitodextrinase